MQYGYGEAGKSEGLKAPVPGGATLTYDITLISMEKVRRAWITL